MSIYPEKLKEDTSTGSQNATQCHSLIRISQEVAAEIQSHCTPDAKIGNVTDDSKPKEQLRTIRLKKLVLSIFASNGCNVSRVCEKVGIDRKTFYRWRDSDREFANGLLDAEAMLNDMVEEKLLIKIFKYDDGASIRFYLSRRHPEFMPKVIVQHSNPTQTNLTLEDLLRIQSIVSESQEDR